MRRFLPFFVVPALAGCFAVTPLTPDEDGCAENTAPEIANFEIDVFLSDDEEPVPVLCLYVEYRDDDANVWGGFLASEFSMGQVPSTWLTSDLVDPAAQTGSVLVQHCDPEGTLLPGEIIEYEVRMYDSCVIPSNEIVSPTEGRYRVGMGLRHLGASPSPVGCGSVVPRSCSEQAPDE